MSCHRVKLGCLKANQKINKFPMGTDLIKRKMNKKRKKKLKRLKKNEESEKEERE